MQEQKLLLIYYFQKRSNVTHIEPSWVNVTTSEDGISLNNYFVENPNMIIGEMKNVSGRFGLTSECVLDDKDQFEELLNNAINNINVSGITFEDNVIDIDSNDDTEEVIPATADVKNFSYAIVDDKIYYRENSLMTLQQLGEVPTKRVKGLVEIRDCLRTLIEYESEDYSDGEIKYQQNKLNVLYDNFTKDYGSITSRANRLAFEKDSSYYLLSSLENIDKNKVVHKADIFTKRTIRPHKPVTSVDTSVEALTVSISEKATIDMEYMQELVGKTEEEIYDDLRGVIFLIHYMMKIMVQTNILMLMNTCPVMLEKNLQLQLNSLKAILSTILMLWHLKMFNRKNYQQVKFLLD